MSVAVDMILGVAVAICWLGAAGLWRLKVPLDRLHCVTFVNVAAGLAVLVAAILTDGASTRVAKLVLLNVAVLWIGAAVANATGRAVWLRGDGK